MDKNIFFEKQYIPLNTWFILFFSHLIYQIRIKNTKGAYLGISLFINRVRWLFYSVIFLNSLLKLSLSINFPKNKLFA
ncbi:hypothetical protein DN752_02735 [Echinicola strongylocentroti]|uniref:Uncharacterized protein n=1 Tax=Echinicola strongylocentroti TaxID=1795355 RepID=A0A2Z4IE85_9BACT|nr:hypothetical protein DN752_02735 [Echinicola strongylocentroti]